ncbi:MAG: cell wall-binding repeat-containing protein [Actinomycetaceae bacterium]|nr:cell wall-binding repeat-containing protein [Actinomycetaceae bacterium]
MSARSRVRSFVGVLAAGALCVVAAVGGGSVAVAAEKRIAGDDRVATSIKVVEATTAWSSSAIIVNKNVFPDALSATPLGGVLKAPIYLTGPEGLDPQVGASMKARGVNHVVLVGGEAVLPGKVLQDVQALGVNAERIAGVDRYATSVEVAKHVVARKGGSVPVAFIATGLNFPDGLTAGATAARMGGILLLSQDGVLPGVVKDYLDSLNVTKLVGAGVQGAKAIESYSKTGITKESAAGSDRYDTAVKLAAYWGTPASVVVVTGENFPDALSAGPYAALQGWPIMPVQKDTVPGPIANKLQAMAPMSIPPKVIGGPAVITPNTATQATTQATTPGHSAGSGGSGSSGSGGSGGSSTSAIYNQFSAYQDTKLPITGAGRSANVLLRWSGSGSLPTVTAGETIGSVTFTKQGSSEVVSDPIAVTAVSISSAKIIDTKVTIRILDGLPIASGVPYDVTATFTSTDKRFTSPQSWDVEIPTYDPSNETWEKIECYTTGNGPGTNNRVIAGVTLDNYGVSCSFRPGDGKPVGHNPAVKVGTLVVQYSPQGTGTWTDFHSSPLEVTFDWNPTIQFAGANSSLSTTLTEGTYDMKGVLTPDSGYTGIFPSGGLEYNGTFVVVP